MVPDLSRFLNFSSRLCFACARKNGKGLGTRLDWSRELSLVRIHVERVIGVLKQKYTILQGVLPISIVAKKDEGNASIDMLVRVCCALVTLCPSVVPQDYTHNNNRNISKTEQVNNVQGSFLFFFRNWGQFLDKQIQGVSGVAVILWECFTYSIHKSLAKTTFDITYRSHYQPTSLSFKQVSSSGVHKTFPSTIPFHACSRTHTIVQTSVIHAYRKVSI